MADLAPLKAALDPRYTIERELGTGGMATVYQANDSKHRRKIAIKVLRPDLAASVGAERFHREIEVAARLQHPHILPLLDSGEANGVLYYVMPFVEGESLRERLTRQGELPVDEAVRVLVEIADALAYAHSQGVVHRDIKPDNVLLSGRHALIVDFGVARAVTEATGERKLTTIGVALGTPQYMSPEQAAADPTVDHRADIYAVGCVAYELLTGRPPFSGMPPQQILAAHITLKAEPVNRQRPAIPVTLAHVVMRCLEKQPEDRWQSADELLTQLEPFVTPSGGTTPASTRPSRAVRRPRSRVLIGITAGVAAMTAAGVGALWRIDSTGPAFAMGRATPLTAEPGLEIEPQLSPDGKYVAYTAGNLNRMRVYVRQPRGRAIPVTPDTGPSQRRPLWSPDGTRLLFLQGPALVVAPALGGTPRVVVRTDGRVTAAAWSPDGATVAYVTSDTLFARQLEGGTARVITSVRDMFALSWSSDGRTIACAIGDPRFSTGDVAQFGNLGQIEIRAVDVATGVTTPVTDRTSLNVSPIWAPDSQMLFFVSDRDGSRDVYSIAMANGKPRGQPRRITTGLHAHSISLSADGLRIAYSVYAAKSNIYAIPLLAKGGQPTMLTSGNQVIETIQSSPDGKRLYFDSDRLGNSDIYRIDLPSGEPVQLTTDPAPEFNAAESPDGRWVAYHSWKHGSRDIFVMARDGGEPVRVTNDTLHERIPHWSPDGTMLAYAIVAAGPAANGVYVTKRDAAGVWGPGRRLDPRSEVGTWVDDSTLVLQEAGDAGLAMISLSGTGRRPLYTRGPDVSRTSSARLAAGALYFKTVHVDGSSTWWRMDRSGGPPRAVARWTDASRPSNRLEFGFDGRFIYTALVDRQSDIFTADFGRP